MNRRKFGVAIATTVGLGMMGINIKADDKDVTFERIDVDVVKGKESSSFSFDGITFSELHTESMTEIELEQAIIDTEMRVVKENPDYNHFYTYVCDGNGEWGVVCGPQKVEYWNHSYGYAL